LVKQLGHEVEHSPLSSAEVKYEWNCASFPPVYLHGMYRGNFMFFTFVLSLACTLSTNSHTLFFWR